MEAETGVRQPQAKGCQELQEARQGPLLPAERAHLAISLIQTCSPRTRREDVLVVLNHCVHGNLWQLL